MPVLLYILAVFTTVLSSAYGIAALASIAGGIAAVLVFRHELAKIKLPTSDSWRTDP